MTKAKGPSQQTIVLIAALVIIALIITVAFTQGRKDPINHEQMAKEQDFNAEIFEIDLLNPGDFAASDLPVSECSLKAVLHMADGPGKPLAAAGQTSRADGNLDNSDDNLIAGTEFQVGTPVSVVRVAATLNPIQPIQPIQPILPIQPIDPPSSIIQVLTPKEGSKLIAGTNFTLNWTIDSGRDPTVDVLFSADGGKTYQTIVEGIANENTYRLKVPNVNSTRCVFRVNAWVGTIRLGYNLSPTFQVVPPVTPTPVPPITLPPEKPPELPNKYPTPSYIADNNGFINQNEDATRWFTVEHELTQVSRVVWQIARVPFTCNTNLKWNESPGILAWGIQNGSVKEFAVDFNAVMSQFKAQSQGPKPVNRGVSFDTVPNVKLLDQEQRALYVRVIMLDKNDKIIGATRSEFQVVYGTPLLEKSAIGMLNPMPDIPRPELAVRSASAPISVPFEVIAEKGKFMYAGGDRDWIFKLSKVPAASVEVDVQISTMPFKYQSMSDFYNPAGLVHRNREQGIQYTLETRMVPVSFSEFAPPLYQLGNNTITYYMRAICYVPGEGAGTVVPVVSETHQIHYTGNKDLFLVGQYDFDNLPPEEVVVKSYVPTTDFWQYYPARWPLDHYEEYFEVTRPIQAEEVNFYIKNHETGDFLYPYPVHLNLYPKTTRAQYQAVLDRMLPPGAWFRLTINQSGWDAIWAEFTTLLKQVYESIQKTYNGLKTSLANLVADRFAFMGSTVQGYIRTAVRALIDYGLASVGLPPSLPNFDALTDSSLDYCVRIALDEAAQSLGVPPEEIPNEIRNSIIDETKSQITNLATAKNVNPLDVDYLKPATEAMYRPAWVDVYILNSHDQWSPPGTLTMSYYPVGKPHFKMYKYVSLPIPALPPKGKTFIRVFLTPDNTDKPIWNDYYWGREGECVFNLTATYHVPDIEIAAKEQGVQGVLDYRADAYVYDMDPVFTMTRINAPKDSFSE